MPHTVEQTALLGKQASKKNYVTKNPFLGIFFLNFPGQFFGHKEHFWFFSNEQDPRVVQCAILWRTFSVRTIIKASF